MESSRDTKRDPDVERWKETLRDLEAYFRLLANTDPKKLGERKESYTEIQEAIEAGDFKKLQEVSSHYEMAFKGKGGAQTYSGILTHLKLIDSTQAMGKLQLAQSELKHQSRSELTTQKNKGLLGLSMELGNLVMKRQTDVHLQKSGSMFADERSLFGRKLDPDVTEKKIDAAQKLKNIIDDFINNKCEIKDVANAVFVADEANKESIKDKKATEGDLGKLIKMATQILKDYYPVAYADAKEKFAQSKLEQSTGAPKPSRGTEDV